MSTHLWTSVCLAGALAVVSAADSAAGELVVIVNQANPTTKLGKDEVRTLYLKKKAAWGNGEKLRPVDLEGDAAYRDVFVHDLLGMSGDDLERYWLELKYRKAESPPKRVDDDESAIKFVATFKGGLGFVDGASLDAAARAKVKVVLTVRY